MSTIVEAAYRLMYRLRNLRNFMHWVRTGYAAILDVHTQTWKLHGLRISDELVRAFAEDGILPVGSIIELTKREDGVLTFRLIDRERLLGEALARQLEVYSMGQSGSTTTDGGKA